MLPNLTSEAVGSSTVTLTGLVVVKAYFDKSFGDLESSSLAAETVHENSFGATLMCGRVRHRDPQRPSLPHLLTQAPYSVSVANPLSNQRIDVAFTVTSLEHGYPINVTCL